MGEGARRKGKRATVTKLKPCRQIVIVDPADPEKRLVISGKGNLRIRIPEGWQVEVANLPSIIG